MKKLFSLMLLCATMILSFSACSSDEESIKPAEEVIFTLDYTFSDKGNMTRSNGEEVYGNFYDKYIKTKILTPTTYSLIFTNTESGARANINGFWSNKDAIRLIEGEYEVTGSSKPIKSDEAVLDTVSLVFNETINITKDMSSITLHAGYDSFLLLFDVANTSQIEYNYEYSSQVFDYCRLSNDDEVYWLITNRTSNTDLTLTRLDGKKSVIHLDDFPFEVGKYYYFNDMTNSFDIPKMEPGN